MLTHKGLFNAGQDPPTPAVFIRGLHSLGVVLDVGHLPKNGFVDKLVGGIDDGVGLLHLRDALPLLLAHIDNRRMQQLLLRRVGSHQQNNPYEPQHNVDWGVLTLHVHAPTRTALRRRSSIFNGGSGAGRR